jgi:hypothetical protein
MCPPRIIAKDRRWRKAAAGNTVTVCLPVDQVRIDLIPGRERADAEHAVFRLQPHLHAGREWLATSVGMPMPRFTYMPSAQLLRGTRGHLFASSTPASVPSSRSISTSMRFSGCG